MHRIAWLIWGAVLGFVAAHFVNRSRAGREAFAKIDRVAREFTSAVARGYHDREAEFASTTEAVNSSPHERS